MARRTSDFQTIRSEGGLLPPDLLRRLLSPKEKISGVRPEDYGLSKGDRLNEAITQSWNRLGRSWAEFRSSAKGLPEGEALTGLTNDKWSLPLLRELGFGFLPTTHSPTVEGRTYAINRFAGPTPIHLVGCGVSLDRRTAGVRGAAAVNPHGLVQEFVNRSSDHLWAIVSNGLRFRLLRDNQALSRQSYLEFDLETMFDSEIYPDFVLFWLVAHATRFIPRESGRAESCFLEQWTKEAQERGTRALTDLRDGVEKALVILGQGFVSHPRNSALREALRSGRVSLQSFHGQLLRVVYRLIFLFVAEDRELDGLPLLHPRDPTETGRTARERYTHYYSARRLRDIASQIKGSPHGDLWRQFNLVVGAISGGERFANVRSGLALPALGSMLWNPASTADLNAPSVAAETGAELANVDFLDALRLLAFTRQGKVLRPVDYKNLGSEEFGGVYESFLALTPQISSDGARFSFAEFAGSERKTSGSYYTPDVLVQCLLDSALDPVIEERLAGKTGKDAEKALLSLKVCDKACGSGHFLVGAAHRLARHLARVRALAEGDSEPSPLLYQHALRDVIGHCVYGVDINPMAVELCKVTLWLEALEPGKPLSFLDHHIQCGNSLLGTTPALISAGLPDAAFEPIEGDDKEACARLKKLNRAQREGLRHLFVAEDMAIRESLRQAAAALDSIGDDQPEEIRRKENTFHESQTNYEFLKARDLADLWCAAFVIKKRFAEPVASDTATHAPQPALPEPPLVVQEGLFGAVDQDQQTRVKKPRVKTQPDSVLPVGITTQHLRDFVESGLLPEGLLEESRRLAGHYQFFHWHLAFPDVFQVPPAGQQPENQICGWNGGFDVNLGNPPWEQVQVDPQEYFSDVAEIAQTERRDKRESAIERLRQTSPQLVAAYDLSKRVIGGMQHFFHNSGRYPLAAKGRINSAPLFVELSSSVAERKGRVGLIVPTGIATDTFTRHLFRQLVSTGRLRSLFDFENEDFLFPNVHHAMRFCLVTIGSERDEASTVDLMFFARQVAELGDVRRRFSLSAADFRLLNPNTNTCPVFRLASDVAVLKQIAARVPVLVNESTGASPWDFSGFLMFMMDAGESVFREATFLNDEGFVRDGSRWIRGDDNAVPLLEGKMIHHFDHRFGTYEGQTASQANQGKLPELSSEQHLDPLHLAESRYWVDSRTVAQRVGNRWARRWFLCWRDITNAKNERTVIASIVPHAATGDTLPIAFVSSEFVRVASALLANLCSFALDYSARQKVSGMHLRLNSFQQIPVLPPETYAQPCAWAVQGQTLETWLLPRVLELTYTAWDLEAFALDCGWSGPPFRWDEDRRFLLRCELDAAFFHLYGLSRDDAAYILDTFPIVRRKDEEKYQGDYRTKRVILEIYDALAKAAETANEYTTRLDPAPASIWVAHSPRWDRDRVNLPQTGDFVLAFLGSLLRHLDGECDLMKLARAYALLLPSRSVFAELADAQFGAGARAWVDRFDQVVEAKWFLPILRAMDNRNIVALEEHGDDVTVRLKDPKGPPTNVTVETDVFLVLRVLDLVPDQKVSAPIKLLVPKAPRIALRETALVPA